MGRTLRYGAAVALAAAVAGTANAGGAWVPEPGNGDLQIGFSRKTAESSWDAYGENLDHVRVVDGVPLPHQHDFRYAYLSGEFGVAPRVAVHFVLTYLYGLEGPVGDLEKNTGASDAWLGAKVRLREGRTPQAVSLTLRTPALYDRGGVAYDRYLRDSEGNVIDVSPEWRGLLKKDLTLSYLVSRSLWAGKGWTSLSAGYTWREGAPADQIPVTAELGRHLPFWKAQLRTRALYVRSRGNDSEREPDDRFGCRAEYCFNLASMGSLGVGIAVPIAGRQDWMLEGGYNQWVWGRSARKYREPYLSVGRSF
jgi:hypothetical protein